MELLLADFVKLGGFAALVTVLVSAGKKVGIVTDSTAGNWNLGLNTLGFVLFTVAHVVNFDVSGVDTLLAQVSNVLVALLALLGQFIVSKGVYAGAKSANLPLVGFSHSK